jgi:poly(A) polymerase
VVQVSLYGHLYEVATFRSDSAYLDGRHPSSVTFCSPEEDARRRDFTINGMFYDPIADRLIDYVRGRSDIRKRVIRTIGNPISRFEEDKLRMLRAIRLSCSLGFKIIPDTWNAIRKLAANILQVSAERIRDELAKLFTGPNPDAGLDLLYDSGLLDHILPEMSETRHIPQQPELPAGANVFAHSRTALGLLRNSSPALVFGTVLHDVGKPSTFSEDNNQCFKAHAEVGAQLVETICRRLKMSNREIDQIVDLVRTHMSFLPAVQMAQSKLKRLLFKSNIDDHLELYRVNCLSNGERLDNHSKYLDMLRELKKMPREAPLLSGRDLIAMGYPPGPAFAEILRKVEDLQLEGILRTREDAVEFVKNYVPEKEQEHT